LHTPDLPWKSRLAQQFGRQMGGRWGQPEATPMEICFLGRTQCPRRGFRRFLGSVSSPLGLRAASGGAELAEKRPSVGRVPSVGRSGAHFRKLRGPKMAMDRNKRHPEPRKINLGTEPSVPKREFVAASPQSVPRRTFFIPEVGKS